MRTHLEPLGGPARPVGFFESMFILCAKAPNLYYKIQFEAPTLKSPNKKSLPREQPLNSQLQHPVLTWQPPGTPWRRRRKRGAWPGTRCGARGPPSGAAPAPCGTPPHQPRRRVLHFIFFSLTSETSSPGQNIKFFSSISSSKTRPSNISCSTSVSRCLGSTQAAFITASICWM